MARHNYRFNPESLSYVKVRRSIAKTIVKFGSYFLASLMLAVIYYIIFSPIYNNAEERRLIRENRLLSNLYDSLSKKYDLFENALSGIKERDTGIYRSIFYSNPVSPFDATTHSNSDKIEALGSHDNITLTKGTAKQMDKLEAMSKANERLFSSIKQTLGDSASFSVSIPAIQPVDNKILTRVGASVGSKIHPFYKILRMHEGIDFTVPVGTDVMATGNGIVESIENSDRGGGLKITVDHGFGYTTVYAHLSKAQVSKGSRVKRGQVIALSGDSGMSIWPHLHYEVRKDGKVCNPVNYFFGELTPEELDVIVYLTSNNGQSLD